ncbi:MAG: hypothetical protein RI965_1536 [Bacteroidota bacterium]|jgi:hypothetical protein
MLQHLIQPSFEYGSTSSSMGSGNFHLCVEFGSCYLSILVFDDHKVPISIEAYTLKEGVDVYTLEYILQNEKYKNIHFANVFLVANGPDNCLIPDKYFKTHLVESIYKSIQGDASEVHIAHDEVDKWELMNVYGVDKFIYHFIMEQFPQTKILHFVSLGLNTVFKNNLEDLDAFMKLYFSPNYLTIILVKGAQLQFAQSVYYETAEDAIYQVLNLIEKHDMDLSTVKTLVSGHIDADSSTWKELRKYILDIDFEDSLIDQFVTDDSLSVSSHFFTPHLQVLQCV